MSETIHHYSSRLGSGLGNFADKRTTSVGVRLRCFLVTRGHNGMLCVRVRLRFFVRVRVRVRVRVGSSSTHLVAHSLPIHLRHMEDVQHIRYFTMRRESQQKDERDRITVQCGSQQKDDRDGNTR